MTTAAVSSATYESADDVAALLAAPSSPEAATAAMLRAVVDTLPGVVFAKDRAGRYLVANANTARALGASCARVIGRTDAEILGDAAEAARLVEVDRRVMATGTAEAVEESVTQTDGTVATWLSTKAPLRDPDGALIGVIGFSVDITGRKAAERAREKSEAQLGAVLDALPVGIIIADADGRIVRDNAANRELWGVPPETASWEGYDEWVGFRPDTGERIGASEWAMSRALRHGDTVRGELVECQQFGSGERRRYLNSAAPVRDAAGAIVGGVVVELDVTDGLPVLGAAT